MEFFDELYEANPDALFADGFADALVGYTINAHTPHVAVYSAQKCVEILVNRYGITHEEAEEFLEFNTYCAYVGPNGPLYVRTILGPTDAAQKGLLAKDHQQEHQAGNAARKATEAGCCNRARHCCESKEKGRKEEVRSETGSSPNR